MNLQSVEDSMICMLKSCRHTRKLLKAADLENIKCNKTVLQILKCIEHLKSYKSAHCFIDWREGGVLDA